MPDPFRSPLDVEGGLQPIAVTLDDPTLPVLKGFLFRDTRRVELYACLSDDISLMGIWGATRDRCRMRICGRPPSSIMPHLVGRGVETVVEHPPSGG